MELSNDLEPMKGEVLHSASRRVRMIFSVMASPNRIDILRILNSKGPMTYSELKALAGFKSKKESGKFAYHLRKLLRQSLVALNKAERRYTITNLGKLVLSLARQIEERSIIERGKMYVRTSNQSIKEFNSYMIIQSLVREANVPLELAQKITEEVENKIYKYQTAYLTAPLIREMVNSVLIEHGYEEYRNKLVRIGMPVFDVMQMMNSVEEVGNGIETLIVKIAQNLLSEYFVFSALPKDIADQHLAGDIHISNSGTWGVIPDSIFVDMNELTEEGINLRGKFLEVSRIDSIKSVDDFCTSFALLNQILSREASSTILIDGIIPLLSKCGNDDSLINKVAKALIVGSGASSYIPTHPITSLNIAIDDADRKQVDALLKGYETYVRATPIPRIGLNLSYSNSTINDYTDTISSIVRVGGLLALVGDPKRVRNFLGICKNLNGQRPSTVISLQSLTMNLPRLAYESNKDETYFRAKLALLLKPAVAALSMRKKTLTDLIRKGLTPLTNSTQFIQKGGTNLVINLIGLHESITNILGYEDRNSSFEVMEKVIKTSVEVVADKGKQSGDKVGISMITDDSSSRFAALDTERYGKTLTSIENLYSQGVNIPADDMINLTKESVIIKECNTIEKLLNGGLSVTMNVNGSMNDIDVKAAIENAAYMLPFFRPVMKVYVCSNCGQKNTDTGSECKTCKSSHILQTQ
ncbi:MAG: ArsR family transcriptional regulator [Thaumarchaeota archaeon]|nr:ArsR family transcriptional regulator [Nitrososphaerota archaeon]